MESMQFSLDVIEIPIKVGDKDYVLREASGDAAAKWRNAMFAGAKLGANGKPESVHNMADTEPLLVSLCLFDAENNKPVSLQTVRSWPSRIITPLFNKAVEISDLGEDDESEVVKND